MSYIRRDTGLIHAFRDRAWPVSAVVYIYNALNSVDIYNYFPGNILFTTFQGKTKGFWSQVEFSDYLCDTHINISYFDEPTWRNYWQQSFPIRLQIQVSLQRLKRLKLKATSSTGYSNYVCHFHYDSWLIALTLDRSLVELDIKTNIL